MNAKHIAPRSRYWIAAALLVCIFSCTQIEVFEKNTPIPKYEWSQGFTITGSFNISDTVNKYNIYLVLRHTDAYKYNNIWLDINLQPPGDTLHFLKVDLQLGSDAAGWEGTGMNDIWEVRKLLNGEARRFKNTGLYKFSIKQAMRDNPLKNVISAGLRIEKQQGL